MTHDTVLDRLPFLLIRLYLLFYLVGSYALHFLLRFFLSSPLFSSLPMYLPQGERSITDI